MTARASRARSCRSRWRGTRPARSAALATWKASRRWGSAARRSLRSRRSRACRSRAGPANAPHGASITAEGAQLGEVAPGGARAGDHRVGRGSLFQHAGSPQVPAHRGDRARALRRGAPARRARASAKSPLRSSTTDRVSRHLRAQSLADRAALLLGEELVAASVPIEARGGALATDRPRGPAAGGKAARRGAVLLRQRPVRTRPGARARRARGVLPAPARRAPARLRALPRARSARGGRERSSGQDRSALPRFTRSAPVREARARARALPERGRSTGQLCDSTLPSGRSPRFTGGQQQSFGLAQPVAAYQAFMGSALPRLRCRRPRRRRRSATRSPNFTGCISWRRTRPASCSSTCTPRTSAS